MASEKEQVLVNVFWAIAGEGWRGVLANLLGLPVDEAAEADPAAAASGNSAGRATAQNPSTLAQVANYASFGTVPLARAIVGLFSGGSESEEPASLTRFALPTALRFESAATEGGGEVRGVDYDQFGMPRAAERTGEASTGQRGYAEVERARGLSSEAVTPRRDDATSGWAGGQSGEGMSRTGSGGFSRRGAVVAPQVTIQVQAMDSRSFLDHSGEIARAVREAMLNMHPLNDVVGDL